MSKQLRFRRTIDPDRLLRNEREVLEVVATIHRQIPETEQVTGNAIEAILGKPCAGTLGVLTSKAHLRRSSAWEEVDGKAKPVPAYSITVKGLQASREEMTGGVSF